MFFKGYGYLEYIDPYDLCEENYDYVVEIVQGLDGEWYKILYNGVLDVYYFTDV